MILRTRFAIILLLVLSPLWGLDQVQFKDLPENIEETPALELQGQPLESTYLLLKFYQGRDNHFAWSESKKLNPAVYQLMKAIHECDQEGLKPENYHVNMIDHILHRIDLEGDVIPLNQFADLDLLLTDAFLTYGSHLLSGSINPYSVDDEWFVNRRTGELSQILEKALESGNIEDELQGLLPTHPVYTRLKTELARYRKIEKTGGWNVVPYGPPLRKGDQDVRIPSIKLRLLREGYLDNDRVEIEQFTPTLERAIQRFQEDHGLEPDGVIGESTVVEMNIPCDLRVRQLRVNLERCRWLPADMGKRYVLVNIPDFRLYVYEEGNIVFDMRVIVGRKMRQTPVFSSQMNQIVLNPSWSVTKNVATTDILSHIQEDPNYLQKMGFKVYDNYGETGTLIDPNSIDWTIFTSTSMPYHFRQRPGPNNALGQIKFLFPNRFDVYLHDTASRGLFEKRVRDFSSGCIRIQKPIDLAEYVLRGDPYWARENIIKALKKGGNEQYISLKETIPVHMMYWTAWVDEEGHVQFRDDLYGRDEPLNLALHPG